MREDTPEKEVTTISYCMCCYILFLFLHLPARVLSGSCLLVTQLHQEYAREILLRGMLIHMSGEKNVPEDLLFIPPAKFICDSNKLVTSFADNSKIRVNRTHAE